MGLGWGGGKDKFGTGGEYCGKNYKLDPSRFYKASECKYGCGKENWNTADYARAKGKKDPPLFGRCKCPDRTEWGFVTKCGVGDTMSHWMRDIGWTAGGGG